MNLETLFYRVRHSILVRLGVAGCCVLLIYLTTRGSSQASDLSWFPEWLTAWADDHNHLPHFVAFLLVSLPAFFCRFPEWEVKRLAHTREDLDARGLHSAHQLFTTFFFLNLAVLLESVQLLLPERSFSRADIAANLAGVGLAWILWKSTRWTLTRNPRNR